jgi:hypothetical protein
LQRSPPPPNRPRCALVDAVVAARNGERRLPLLGASMRWQAAARLGPADRPILAMRLACTSPNEIAGTVGITHR